MGCRDDGRHFVAGNSWSHRIKTISWRGDECAVQKGGYIRATTDVLGGVGKKASPVYKKVGVAKGKNVPPMLCQAALGV